MYKLILIISLIFSSCVNSPSPNPPKGKETPDVKLGDFSIKKIDGCEYVVYDYGVFDQRVFSMTHKGDCKNQIHMYNYIR